ncbi:MAG: MarC family protein, partial [Elusimicrobiaceae bacterium]|nr:MarC family protein [Elusimicrobiaceae bacterium]
PKNDPKEDEPFIVPLAIPLVAGPAALSMVMITAAQQPKWLTLGAVVVASVINSIILMSSFPLSNLLGKRGLAAIERLTGMILILMSVDMVMSGISTFVNL